MLSDPAKKAKYDAGQDLEEIEQGGGMHSHMDPNDVFAAMFGGGGGCVLFFVVLVRCESV